MKQRDATSHNVKSKLKQGRAHPKKPEAVPKLTTDKPPASRQPAGKQVSTGKPAQAAKSSAQPHSPKESLAKRKPVHAAKSRRRPALAKPSEYVCFVCKHGVTEIACQAKNCLKSYHRRCIGHTESDFLAMKGRWICGWHNCAVALCSRTDYRCLTCPQAFCAKHLPLTFRRIDSSRGICADCYPLVRAVEESMDRGLHRDTLTDADVAHNLFLSYWKSIRVRHVRILGMPAEQHGTRMGVGHKLELEDRDRDGGEGDAHVGDELDNGEEEWGGGRSDEEDEERPPGASSRAFAPSAAQPGKACSGGGVTAASGIIMREMGAQGTGLDLRTIPASLAHVPVHGKAVAGGGDPVGGFDGGAHVEGAGDGWHAGGSGGSYLYPYADGYDSGCVSESGSERELLNAALELDRMDAEVGEEGGQEGCFGEQRGEQVFVEEGGYEGALGGEGVEGEGGKGLSKRGGGEAGGASEGCGGEEGTEVVGDVQWPGGERDVHAGACEEGGADGGGRGGPCVDASTKGHGGKEGGSDEGLDVEASGADMVDVAGEDMRGGQEEAIDDEGVADGGDMDVGSDDELREAAAALGAC
eukprot:jgi/Mesvir1/12590/Mv02449-RA.1